MKSGRDMLLDHFGTGVTTVCRAWSVCRTDGAKFGFTDHDRNFSFDGIQFKASTGMTARALQQSTGLSVDNSEAVGGFSDAAVTEADLFAGRFDGAEVRCWLVNWASVEQRIEQFRGSFGEIVSASGTFKVELRGLTDRLNQPQGRIFQRSCSAVLGDKKCKFDLSLPGYRVDAEIAGFDPLGRIQFEGISQFPDRWFERGRFVALTGAALGLAGMIKSDRVIGLRRDLDIWHKLGAELRPGDMVRLDAGCDRQSGTCSSKFSNFLNFRGFPNIPGEDWLASYPVSTRPNDGGSLG